MEERSSGMRETEERRELEEWELSEEEDREPELILTKQERRWIALGALKSALLIGAVYLIAGAFLIWLMLTIWT